MKPVWAQVKNSLPGVVFKDIDEDKTRTPGIKGYPTIIATKNNKRFEYFGGANVEKLQAWIKSIA